MFVQYPGRVTLPPKFLEADFDLLGSLLEFDVERRFGRKVQVLHAFLNNDSVVRTAHQQRREWKSRAKPDRAFENLGSEARHWYTFNAGGRTEAQLNVGMFGGRDGHLRIGLGFEMTERKGGRPAAVQFIFAAFVKLLKERTELVHNVSHFVEEMGLEVEFWGPSSTELEIVGTSDALRFITSLTRTAHWVFLGKLLRLDTDAAVLAEPADLASAIDDVFRGILPIWREANVVGSLG